MSPSSLKLRELGDQLYPETKVTSEEYKVKYWTPDGREVSTAPSMVEWARKDSKGRIIESGLRDGNLDRGWLLQKPSQLKLYCAHCDKWHDTKKEVDACGARKKAFDTRFRRVAKRELRKNGSGDNERIDKIEKDMTEIKTMIKKLLEAKA